jgi:hypothetical protein
MAPCAGDPQTAMEHDALVNEIVGWLTGRSDVTLRDPLERADEVMRTLSRQKRYEEARELRDACEHLLSVRRSYESLADARSLRFAALWPQSGNGDGPSVRLNLVWDGALRDPVSLYPQSLAEGVAAALEDLAPRHVCSVEPAARSVVAVPQKQLDSFLAIRRWFYETGHDPKIPLPGPGADPAQWEDLKTRLVSEASGLLCS